ncbi:MULTISPECIES: acyl carrier protein [unclassified Plantactinospora]|uniref:acyl carrier protein n=1 Tax=unclassified Plantactinospora TaxID=2631981 RepID=UPI000D151C9B|nr:MULTISPECIES: acyl carrier protein [unclassified Plantactinospora]AVT32054.1 phosphopantetheine-binding protein [Plantactinospora sp. BC1]AVT40958.1 phosphopantetheine-binding protein [Plantactinospora sp. BB1]
MTHSISTSYVEPGEELLDLVRRAIAQVLDRDPAEIGPDSRLFDDLGLDSTSALELLMEIEADSGVEFDMDTLEQHHFTSVRALAGYVRCQLDG